MNATLLSLATILAQAAQAGHSAASHAGGAGGAGAGGAGGGGHSMMLIWGIVLIASGMALFMVEILVPSGGIIGLAAAGAVVAGIVFLFRVDTTFGLIGAIVATAALPFLLGAAIKLWPDTPIARLLVLKTPLRGPQKGKADNATDTLTAIESGGTVQVGDTGRAITPLRPVGTVLFSGKREECLAMGGVIDKDATVRVVNIDGRHIKVKEMTND